MQTQTTMTAIPFDKLIVLFGRLWDELFRRTGDTMKNRDPRDIHEEEANQVISFPIPFEELPGKHGRGRAVRQRDGAPRFMVSVLYALAQEDLLSYFDVQPPRDSPDIANDPRTTIEPSLAAAADTALLAEFTKEEQAVLWDLANAVKRLGLEEIRALGTHENFEKTAQDIEREFRYMIPHIAKIKECIQAGVPFDKPALEVMECAEEAYRKSEGNKQRYDFAWRAFQKELTHPTLKEAFLYCQRSATEIWGQSRMKDLVKQSRAAYIRAKYLNQIGRWSADRRRPPRAEDEEEVSELVQKLKRIGVDNLPVTPSKIFVDESDAVLPTIKQKLLALLQQLTAS